MISHFVFVSIDLAYKVIGYIDVYEVVRQANRQKDKQMEGQIDRPSKQAFRQADILSIGRKTEQDTNACS